MALIFTHSINAFAENNTANTEHNTYVNDYINICDYYIKALKDMRKEVKVI